MNNSDTVELLTECDSGIQMAVSSIDEVLDRVEGSELKGLLSGSKAEHESMGRTVRDELEKYNSKGGKPAAMAKGMSWIKTNVKLGMDESDATIADLMTDGCDMGVKTLHRYMNKYQGADEKSRQLCQNLINEEMHLCHELQPYL